MFFTEEDYRKIEKWLVSKGVMDTQFSSAAPLDGNETVAIVQNGKNVNTTIDALVEKLFLLGVDDFLNVTDKYEQPAIPLIQAISLIPFRHRRIGQVITFLNEDNKWVIYQFQGSALTQWNNPTQWVNVIGSSITEELVPDEEDLTGIKEGDKTVLKFKNKSYNTANFSGLGRVYLRKNITEDRNILTQQMINQENTRYILQYDYDLNGQTITIPANCVIEFEGGSISNGVIKLSNNCHINNGKIIQLERDHVAFPFLIKVIGDNCIISNCTIFNPVKSTMPEDSITGIVYNIGGVSLEGKNTSIINCNIYNFEGAGVYDYGESNTVTNNHIHDNCTGIICQNTKFSKIINNIIEHNDVNNGEGYDGILSTTDGLIIEGNLLDSNGEHGLYIHGKNITISNNISTNNYFNGIKCGTVENCTISNNTCIKNNISGYASEGEIFIQKPLNKIVIDSNIAEVLDNSKIFIRVWSNYNDINDGNIIITNNIGIGKIDVFTHNNINIVNNSVSSIYIGYDDGQYPKVKAELSNNTVDIISLRRTDKCEIYKNTIKEKLEIINSTNVLIKDNFIQTLDNESGKTLSLIGNTFNTTTKALFINDLETVIDNIFNTESVHIITQGATKPTTGIKISGNKINTTGGKFLYFWTEALCPNGFVIENNNIEGGTETIQIYGRDHIISLNKSTGNLCYNKTFYSYYTNNLGKIGFREGSSNNYCSGNIGTIGNTAETPSIGVFKVDGDRYYNTDTKQWHYCNNSVWCNEDGTLLSKVVII